MGMFLEMVLISLVTPIGSCNCMGVVSILRNTIVRRQYLLSNNSVTVCCVSGSSIFVPLLGFCQLQRCLFCIMPFILKASSLCFLSGSCHHFLCFWSLPSCLAPCFHAIPWCWSPSWIPSSSISRLGSNMNAAAPCYLVSLCSLLSFCSHTSVCSLIDHAGFDVC